MATPTPKPQSDTEPGVWALYVLISASLERTYVGVALDAERRLRQHNGELVGGARSTRAGRPWRLAALYGPFADRAAAQAAEAELKRRTGSARLAWDAPRMDRDSE